MVWKFCGKAPHSFARFTRNFAETAIPQNFHTRKLDEITVFYAVKSETLRMFLRNLLITNSGLELDTLIAARLSWNRPNHRQTRIERPLLYIGHF